MANTHSLDLESTSSQFASIADASQTGLEPGIRGTWEMWIKPESLPGAGRVSIMNKGGEGSSAYITWRLDYDTGSVYQGVDFSGDNRDYYRETSTALSTGSWQHLAVSWDLTQASASTFEFYNGGVSKGNGTGLVANNATSYADNAYEFIIGKHKDPGTPANEVYFDGLVDDVRFWNDVRTSTEISDNYNAELTGSETNLQGYWKLNNDYLDETSNNNDLTASGSPVFSTDVPFSVAAFTPTVTIF